jgi:hypothetical protein
MSPLYGLPWAYTRVLIWPTRCHIHLQLTDDVVCGGRSSRCCYANDKLFCWEGYDLCVLFYLDLSWDSTEIIFVYFLTLFRQVRARGSAVVKVLCCKPEGREFEILGVIQPLTEMCTRSRKIMFLGSRARPVRRADNLTAICAPTMWDPYHLTTL